MAGEDKGGRGGGGGGGGDENKVGVFFPCLKGVKLVGQIRG